MRTLVDKISADSSVTTSIEQELGKLESASEQHTGCFHCGDPCLDNAFAKSEKKFCCQGCLIVHELLTENGLGHFYDLSQSPGIRIRRKATHEQWMFLDEPELQQRLLDFTDGIQSRVTLHIPAIHCIACVWLLENLFRLHPGIGRSQANFFKREVAITFATQKIKLNEVVTLLVSIGYEPSLTLGDLEKRVLSPARKRQWLQVGIAGFAFGNIMLFSLPLYLGLDSISGAAFKTIFGLLSLALALPVVVYSASDYWKSALLSLRQRVLTLDVPIVLGLAAIYGQSVFEIATGRGSGYCDSLTGLIFFLLCGKVFQQKTHERLAFDRDYKSFFPLSVTRKTSTEERISLSQLQTGDHVVIRNGELIPADAKLVSGPALIDYSFVTGESEPIAKIAGDYLYAGGQQTGAAIEIETLKPVSQSYLTSLWNHAAFQKNRDDNLNTLTNCYSRRFTLIVITVAVGAAIFWIATGNWQRGIKAFASVLIVACPCALALAAPFTLGTVQRLLARIKIFLKNTIVLEHMARVDAIVFDKTGTLTASSTSVVNFHGSPLNKAEGNWICSLTRHSTHPHSVRIGESLAKCHLPEPLHSFREIPGKGIEGQVQGHEIWLGSRAWLESRNTRVKEMDAERGSTVHVAIDGKYRGTFALSNTLRPDIKQLIRQLDAHYEIALLSGDNEKERALFCELFDGNASLFFNQSPLDKLSFIRCLQQSGKTVMMVGDGLNDAGALKQSDVGVAVIEKVGAFSPASDIIIETAQISRLADVLVLARQSARIVRLSFAISAFYNLVGVSIAAAGILSPLVCAVLMPLSSLTVVLFACGAATWAVKRNHLLCECEVIETAFPNSRTAKNRLKVCWNESELNKA